MTNALTIDLEDWYQGNELVPHTDASRYEDRIEFSTSSVLDILAEYKTHATFFILGHIAEKKPSLIRTIADAGHEIGSHGYSHRLIYKQTPAEFEEELCRSKDACEQTSGRQVMGHRASNWSITRTSLWALDILKKHNFHYDSSIYPAQTYLYGISGAPRFVHRLENGLLEIPPSTVRIAGRCLPFSGGFYLRMLPLFLLKRAVSRIHKENQPAVLYLHPWELDIDQPRTLGVPFKNRLIHYTGLHSTERKLRALLSAFRFDRMDRVFDVANP
ncbi:MAG: DUF3473 domain-containing protein [bacterium]|nr:DUF3473 domain-containing protein [bacterium]